MSCKVVICQKYCRFLNNNMSVEKTIASRYIIKEEIGKGSFGVIYLGEHVVSHLSVAIKLEPVEKQSLQLKNESKIYKVLAGCPGIPEVYWFGTENKYNVLVMDYLGSSMEYEMMRHNQSLSLKTVLMFADQAISLIQYLHERHFIHRDIKPENFLIGNGKNSNIIYLIDFGLSKKYRDPKTKEHIPYRGDKELVGTSRYVSISTHLGIEQSRRDDLESLGYVMIYLLKGSLPWQGIQTDNLKQKYEKISEKKMTTSFETLCEGLPEEFIKYFEIVRALDFVAEPPYATLRQLFRDLMIKKEYAFDYQYDWSPQKGKETSKGHEPVPMHAPIFKDHEAGLEILPQSERPHPNFKYSKFQPTVEPQVDPTLIKARTAPTNKRIWRDPGARKTFPRGPPPIPAKMLPPPKKAKHGKTIPANQNTFALLVSPSNSLHAHSLSQQFELGSTTPSLASEEAPHPNTAPEPQPSKPMDLNTPYQPEEIPEDDEN